MSFGQLTETGRPVKIKDEGVTVTDNVASLDFNGAGVSVTGAADSDVEIPGSSGGASTALDNLAAVAINAALVLGTSDAFALGSATKMWADLFLASGAVVNFNNGDVTITHGANSLAFAGASSGYTFDAVVTPTTNDAAALGSTSLGWSDLHLATGGVINWANGEMTITESDANTLTIAGGNLVATLGATTLAGTVSGGGQNLNNIIIGATTPLAGTFTTLIANTSLKILEGGATPSKYTIFQGGDQAIDLTYTLPTAYPTVSGYVLSSTDAGIMSWVSAGGVPTTITVANEASDTTCFPLFVTAATGDLGPKTNAAFIFDSSTGQLQATLVSAATAFIPDTNDGAALGTTALQFSDLFLAEGGVINWDNGDATMTQTADDITFAGISTMGLGVSTVLALGSIELGHASDTTIARVSAGVASIEGVTIDTISGANTLSNKTLTAPKFASAGFIADANGNELIIFTTTASAVNEWTLANGATGVNPKLTASGETNVGLDFQVKGTGVYRFLGTASGPAELRLYEDTDDGSNYSAFKVGTQAADITYTLPTAVSAAGGYLYDSAGNGVLSWNVPAAGGGTPQLVISTIFESIDGHFNSDVTAGATFTVGAYGAVLSTSATTTSGLRMRLLGPGTFLDPNAGNPTFSCLAAVTTAPTAGSSHFGTGWNTNSTGTGLVYTARHAGFKIVYAASTATLSASNADGTTETATTISATVGNVILYHFKRTANTNIKYYTDRTLGATHTTNLPTGTTDGVLGFAISNNSAATNFEITFSFASWTIDAE